MTRSASPLSPRSLPPGPCVRTRVSHLSVGLRRWARFVSSAIRLSPSITQWEKSKVIVFFHLCMSYRDEKATSASSQKRKMGSGRKSEKGGIHIDGVDWRKRQCTLRKPLHTFSRTIPEEGRALSVRIFDVADTFSTVASPKNSARVHRPSMFVFRVGTITNAPADPIKNRYLLRSTGYAVSKSAHYEQLRNGKREGMLEFEPY